VIVHFYPFEIVFGGCLRIPQMVPKNVQFTRYAESIKMTGYFLSLHQVNIILCCYDPETSEDPVLKSTACDTAMEKCI